MSIRSKTITPWLLFLLVPQLLASDEPTARAGRDMRNVQTGHVIEMSDGKNKGLWKCDPDLVRPGSWHHVAIVVDGGPKVISFVVDGMLCDGGADSIYGWGRFSPELGDVTGSGRCRVASSMRVRLERLRIYDRYLRTSEAIANYHAGR